MEKKTVLENKVIKVKPIIRPRPFFRKGHDGEFMYTGCKRVYGLPFSATGRSFFNPFLDKNLPMEERYEQKEFERLLNQKEGALSLYNLNSKFWSKFTFTLTKDGMDLDLSNPTHALIYRMMLVNPKFANDESSKDIPECEYYLLDEVEEEKVISEKAELQDKAMDYMYKIKKSKTKMYNILRMLDKKPDKEASIDWFKRELYKILNQTGETPGVVGIKQFLQVMEDPTAETKIFVLDAIDNNEIVQGAEGYRIADGEFIGRDIQSLYDYFNQNSPEVREKMQIIKQRLKN